MVIEGGTSSAEGAVGSGVERRCHLPLPTRERRWGRGTVRSVSRKIFIF